MKIIFFGTTAFAAKILEFLIAQGEEIVAVVTRPDQPQGRSLKLGVSPVKECILSSHAPIPLFQPIKASTDEFVATLKQFQPDLFVVVAYGEIIKKNLLQCPKLGAVNIHASLLPKYRGAAPIQRAIMQGEKETGITIIDMVEQMDAGAMLEIAKIPISDAMTFGELNEELCRLAARTIFKVIQAFKNGKVMRVEQDESQKTFANKLMPEDEKIHWSRSALEIHNQVRALSPSPGAWTFMNEGEQKKRLKIKKASPLSGDFGAPGQLIAQGKGEWCVSCGQGALRLIEVQLEGKKMMSADEFFRGRKHQLLKFDVL